MKFKKFFKKKWLRVLLIVIIGIGIFLYFWFQKPEVLLEEIWLEEIPEEFKADQIPPLTLVKSPPAQSWHSTSFQATIYDSDIGSGLVSFLPRKKGCRYIIKDLGTGEVVGDYRQCERTEIFVLVGEERVCSSSYQKDDLSQGKCRVSSMAIDKAGNQSGWRSRDFNIDLIKPEVSEISAKTVNLGKPQLYSSSVSDNHKITSCWFFVNNELVETKIEISPIPCKDGINCSVSTNYAFSSEGEYFIRFGCKDYAGSYGYGNPTAIKIITNHPPEISSCRVKPTQGTSQTNFQFEVEATDLDGNDLSYSWDFGDGETSIEQNPTHSYHSAGTYEPRVTVSDGKEEVSCSTAWVTISE